MTFECERLFSHLEILWYLISDFVQSVEWNISIVLIYHSGSASQIYGFCISSAINNFLDSDFPARVFERMKDK